MDHTVVTSVHRQTIRTTLAWLTQCTTSNSYRYGNIHLNGMYGDVNSNDIYTKRFVVSQSTGQKAIEAELTWRLSRYLLRECKAD